MRYKKGGIAMRLASRNNLNPYLRLLLNPSETTTATATSTIRRLSTSVSADANSEILSVLQTTPPDTWPSNPLLSTITTSLTPDTLLTVTRQLNSSENALHFFDYIKSAAASTATPASSYGDLLSATLQAVLEHVSREGPNSSTKLHSLYLHSKDQNVPLSAASAALLIRSFGRVAGMVDEMLSIYNTLEPSWKSTHLTNVTMSALFRSGRTDEAFKLLDKMLGPGSQIRPNDSTIDIVLVNAMKRNWIGSSANEDEILKLMVKFGKRGVFPNNTWLSQLITKFCRNRNTDKAWELLQEVMSLGGKVEAVSCNALLTGLGKDGDFRRMNSLMKEMNEKNVQPNVVTFGILINHLCKVRRVDDALEVLEKMKGGCEVGSNKDAVLVEPDNVIYNTLIDGLCKVGRQEEGFELMERMRKQPKCAPNTVTFNCLIDGFCKAGEIERSLELFHQMNKESVEPNVITLNCLLDGMCRHGRVNSAIEFFNGMKEKGLKGNAITYTVLIAAFSSANNVDKAMKLFDEMLENGCSPDAIVYCSLISGLSQAGRMDDASFVWSRMKEAGFRLDVVGYNILIVGFCRRSKLDRAIETLKDMEQAGVKPDHVTYNTLISYFCKVGDFATAHKVIKKMIKGGFKPTVVTYGALIHAYCEAGKLEEALQIYKEMSIASKVPPNNVIYNMLIDTLCKNDKVEAALLLMDDMKDRRVSPNTTTFNSLLKGLKERNWLKKAFELMDTMTKEACNPDYITMEILTQWLPQAGETEKLRRFAQGYEVSAPTA